jgi:rhodanese-related sulfurtransferase
VTVPRTIDELLASARSRLDRLEPRAAHAAMSDGALLVDIRCAELRAETGAVPGSVHVPLSVLYWRLDPSSPHADPRLADRSRKVVLLCAHGYSSSLAAATLRDLGYLRATDVVGGFEGWAEAGLPIEPPPGSAGPGGPAVRRSGRVSRGRPAGREVGSPAS